MSRRIVTSGAVVCGVALWLAATPMGSWAQQTIRNLTLSGGWATPAANFTNPTDAVTAWALSGCYDGSTWDPCPIASGGTGAVDANTTRTVEASDESHSVISAASNNATSVKAAAGVLRTIAVVNTTSTVYYMRFYDLATAPTCSSATGFTFTLPIPPDNGGWSVPLNVGFDTGIGYCITGGGSPTDDTAAATGIFGVVTFK